jgi:excisionase family DNA binding protein
MRSQAKIHHSNGKSQQLLTPSEAALELRISFSTIKQWIYKRKIRSIKTAGGHLTIFPRVRLTGCFFGHRQNRTGMNFLHASGEREQSTCRAY